MRDVLFVFKLLEACISIVCLAIHIVGIEHRTEPLPHDMFFCGIFMGFLVMSFVGIGALIIQVQISVIVEAFESALGFIGFGTAGIISMFHAERDTHLMYLTDSEEYAHPYFHISRMQSIASMANTFMYLMHFTFMLDILIVREKPENANSEPEIVDHAVMPLKLRLPFDFKFKCLHREQADVISI